MSPHAKHIRSLPTRSPNSMLTRKTEQQLRQLMLGSQRGGNEAACVTRLFVVKNHVAAFYALSSAEARLTSSSKLQRMGIMSGGRMGRRTWNGFVATARASGTSLYAVKHAIFVATKIAALQGNRALTLDPFDEETQDIWKAEGFHMTQTELR